MIQLGYYPTPQQQDESLDFDPNYDPSDFLIKKDSNVSDDGEQAILQQVQQQPYQENYEYPSAIQEAAGGDEIIQPNYFYGQQQQQSSFTDYSFQSQQQSIMQEDFSQSQAMMSDGGGLADLEISDSEDDDENDQNEETNTSENPVNTSKDDEDGLWF